MAFPRRYLSPDPSFGGAHPNGLPLRGDHILEGFKGVTYNVLRICPTRRTHDCRWSIPSPTLRYGDALPIPPRALCVPPCCQKATNARRRNEANLLLSVCRSSLGFGWGSGSVVNPVRIEVGRVCQHSCSTMSCRTPPDPPSRRCVELGVCRARWYDPPGC